MSAVQKSIIQSIPNVLRRMRESSGLTMRQVGAMIGISHCAISQFENQKLDLPDYRIEQLVKAYGFTMVDFEKITKHKPVMSPKDDCYAMLERMDGEQMSALQALMKQMLRTIREGGEECSEFRAVKVLTTN